MLFGTVAVVGSLSAVLPAPVARAAGTDADTCIASRWEGSGGVLFDRAVRISSLGGASVGATHRALAFSPDGSQIIFLSQVGDDFVIMIAAVDGTGERVVYTFDPLEALYSAQHYLWSSNGRYIAMITGNGVETTERLKVVDVGASPHVSFTSAFEVAAEGFDFSPDGTRIVYSDASGVFDGGDLWVANTDGSGSPARIVDDTKSDSALPPYNPPKSVTDLRWSPDGTTIAYSGRNGITSAPSQTAAYQEIYLVNPDGSNLRSVGNVSPGEPDTSRVDPTWSPDSKQVAFTHDRADSNGTDFRGIARVDIASGVVTEIASAAQLASYSFSGRMEWSPSGGTLVAAATGQGGNGSDYVYGVWALPITGSTPIRIETHSTQGSLPRALVGLVPCGVVQPGTYQPLVPARLLETRPGYPTFDGQFAGIGARAAGSVTELQVTGRAGVAADANAVVLNIAVTGAQAPGFVTVFPCGSDRPTAANLNYAAGDTIPNLVIAKVGVGGRVCIYTYAATDLIADVNGAFSPGASYQPLVPARLLESRSGLSTIDGQANGIGLRPAGSVTELVVAGRGGVPADAAAVVLNVAVTDTQAPGYITVFPCGSDRPTAANLNYAAGDTIPNLVIAKVGVGGKVCIYTYAATNLIADVNGAFPTRTSYQALVPARVLESRTNLSTVDGGSAGIGKRSAGSVTKFSVQSRAGVPLDASAVVLNIAVTEAEAPGFLTVYPCDAPRPTAANLNYAAGDTIPNLVIASTGADGMICVYTYARTHLVIDVNGAVPDYR